MTLMSPSMHTRKGQNNDTDMLDRLHAMLKKVDLTDDQILSGVKLTAGGYQKVGAALGISADEAALLFKSLITKLRRERDELNEMVLEYGGQRFSYEEDFLGNVTVRDSASGKSVFLRGTEAHRLLNSIKAGGDDQAILSQYESLMENEQEHAKTLRDTGFWGKQGAGCIILARATGRILLAHRSEDVEQPGTWGCWGGAIDEGENPVDAVERECGEEAGFRGAIEKIVPLYVFKKDNFRYHNFLVVIEDEFDPHLNWESQGYEWCELGQWPSPLHFGLKALFADAPSVAKIKAELQPVSETVMESVLEEDTYDDEIRSTGGSFNFPWRHGDMQGFATARFNGRGDQMVVKVVNVRDMDGNVIDFSSFADVIEKQAFDFIGEE